LPPEKPEKEIIDRLQQSRKDTQHPKKSISGTSQSPGKQAFLFVLFPKKHLVF